MLYVPQTLRLLLETDQLRGYQIMMESTQGGDLMLHSASADRLRTSVGWFRNYLTLPTLRLDHPCRDLTHQGKTSACQQL